MVANMTFAGVEFWMSDVVEMFRWECKTGRVGCIKADLKPCQGDSRPIHSLTGLVKVRASAWRILFHIINGARWPASAPRWNPSTRRRGMDSAHD